MATGTYNFKFGNAAAQAFSKSHQFPSSITDSSGSLGNAGQEAPSQNDPGHLAATGRSMSERFQVDSHTGGVSFTIPVETSAGRSGFGPALQLQYNSAAASVKGPFGLGWSLAGIESISRKTCNSIPTYDDDKDTFVHSTLGDLVPELTGNGESYVESDVAGYRVRRYWPRVESAPVRIERWTKGKSIFWKTISEINIATVFGLDESNQVFHRQSGDPSDPKRIFSWLASECYDSHGNHIVYSYKAEDGSRIPDATYEAHRTDGTHLCERYPKSIRYGNAKPTRRQSDWKVVSPLPSDLRWLFEVVFDYGEHDIDCPTTQGNRVWDLRPDPFSTYRSGFEIRTYRRCRRILMFHHFPKETGRQDCLVASTCFRYQQDLKSGLTVLQSCIQRGHRPTGKDQYWTSSLPAFEFDHQKSPALEDLPMEELDLGMSGLASTAAEWIDLNGEGTPGVLTRVPGGGWYYQRNQADDHQAQVGCPQQLSKIPNTPGDLSWDFEDLEGDGLPAVLPAVQDGALRGFYGRAEDGSWKSFASFVSCPIVDADTHEFRRIDLTGNGRADWLQVVLNQDQEMIWYPSLGSRGFGESRRTIGAPSLSLQDPNTAVLCCDMSGDGLTDLVSISCGNICYWPNLGHGRFGTKVTMENAPYMARPNSFSPMRIRTADITGSGTTDLIYLLPEGGAMVYYNRGGNSWHKGDRLASIPALDHLSAVDILDIAGRGTACLCWTSDLYSATSRVHFVDLNGRQHPGLLSSCSNGIGGEVKLNYRSSSLFYRDDEQAGRPWTTRLPFPLQCVARITVEDRIAQTSQVKQVAYHNGYYDPINRQFQGFQMIEMWDADGFLDGTAVAFQQPPVLTRSWYYIGLQKADGVTQLPWSYNVSHPQHTDIPSATLSGDSNDQERHEAYRALSGRPRRQEIFSGGQGDYRSSLPYAISQQTYNVVLRQGIAQNQRYAICRVDDQEQVTAHYDRVASNSEVTAPCTLNLNEARVQHQLALKMDQWGRQLLVATVQYGKLDSELPRLEDQQRQTEHVINYTETTYTNAVESPDCFHAPVVATMQQYRVFPACLPNDSHRYSHDTLTDNNCEVLLSATEIPIHGDVAERVKLADFKGYKVLLAKEQIHYTDDMDSPLPHAALTAFAAVYQTYRLAFTSELLNTAYASMQDAINTDLLQKCIKEGGYVELPPSSGQWWLPSPRALFGDDLSGDCLAAARSQWYIPNAQVDPHGNISAHSYDDYRLLVRSSADALLNETHYENDYVCMRQAMVTDPNGNRTRMAFDPLGCQIGVAVMGKTGQIGSDSLDQFSLRVGDEDLDRFYQDPCGTAESLLGTATCRTIYDFGRYSRSGQFIPCFAAQLVRCHDSNAASSPQSETPISIHIAYLSGTGGRVQEATLTAGAEDPGGKAWTISGWVLHDNKAQPVKQYHPSTATSHCFQRQDGDPNLPASTFLRDALGRVVGVLNADHTWTKMRVTPWVESKFDAGGTILIGDPAKDIDVGGYFQRLNPESFLPTWYQERTTNITSSETNAEDRAAAEQSKVYHSTVFTKHIDAAGHPICHRTSSNGENRETRSKYNARGQVEVILDSIGRTVDVKQYDLLGRPLHTCNIDQGHRWLLSSCQGAPILSWSGRGVRMRMEFDKLWRPTNTWVQHEPAGREVLTIKKVYGDHQATAVEHNLKGQLWRCYDQSGVRTNDDFDFRGNCIQFSFRYAIEYKDCIDWSTTLESTAIEGTAYQTSATFNRSGQPLEVRLRGVGMIQRDYDVAGRLKALRSYAPDGHRITSSAYNIQYEPDHQVKSITYGNGAKTMQTFDLRSRRLLTTRTSRTSDGKILRDLSHTYDCMGNIVHTTDHAQQTIFFQNAVVPPVRRFWYDFVGQLIKATGREQVNAENGGSTVLEPYHFNSGKSNHKLGDGRQVIRYEEQYTYDKCGNLLQVQHIPASPYSGWTRKYTYNEQSCIDSEDKSNRLTSTCAGGRQENYRYSGPAGRHGAMTAIPGFSSLSWNYMDSLQSFSTQMIATNATPETTWYVYDASGARVRKITERSAGAGGSPAPTKSKETRYLPMYDISISYGGNGTTVTDQITTLHVGDAALGEGPVAMLEDGHESGLIVRYQAGPHLELDDVASPISYEEYSPFGPSTYRYRCKGQPRRYRFAAYRRDVESGLYHCGARYYAPWLGRWISADPLGTIDGLNLYSYVGNNPINFQDHRGTIKGKAKGGRAKASGSTEGWQKVPKSSNDKDDMDMDIYVSPGAGKEIRVRCENPIVGGLQMIRNALNDESGTHQTGYAKLGRVPENQLIHGIKGESSAELTVPAVKNGKATVETLKINPKEKYKYQFRIDYDITKAERHVNVQIDVGGNTRKFALFYKDEEDQPRPRAADTVVPLELRENIDFDVDKSLEKRGTKWITTGRAAGDLRDDDPAELRSAKEVAKWHKAIKHQIEANKLKKGSEAVEHAEGIFNLTVFGRSAGSLVEPDAQKIITSRVWLWTQYQLDSARFKNVIEELHSCLF